MVPFFALAVASGAGAAIALAGLGLAMRGDREALGLLLLLLGTLAPFLTAVGAAGVLDAHRRERAAGLFAGWFAGGCVGAVTCLLVVFGAPGLP